jgi:hypothetical protein
MLTASSFALTHTDTLPRVAGVLASAVASIIVVVLLITPTSGAG